jgi:tetratricopeptide (TPR) repeat protein
MDTQKQGAQSNIAILKDEHQKPWVVKELSAEDAKLELLGYKLYAKFQILIPEQVYLRETNQGNQWQLISSYEDFHKLPVNFVKHYLEQSSKSRIYSVTDSQNKEKLPLRGLGKLLAVACFLYDNDCIGPQASNIGWIRKVDSQGIPFAQVIKIDPAQVKNLLTHRETRISTLQSGIEPLNYNPVKKRILLSTWMENLYFHELMQEDQTEFIQAIEIILQVPEEDLHTLVREVQLSNEHTQDCIERLILRKRRLCGGYFSETTEQFNKTRIRKRAQLAQSGKLMSESQDPIPKMTAEISKLSLQVLQENNCATKINFQLPPAPWFFIGRKQELDVLKDFLVKENQSVINQSISGMGGVGKTHLALYYAHSMIKENVYHDVVWIFAEYEIEIQLRELASFLCNIEDRKLPLEEVRNQIYLRLSERGQALVVWDNGISPSELEQFLPKNTSKFPRVHNLITSRCKTWPQMNVLELGGFSKEEGREFVRFALGDQPEEEVEKLLECLQNYPLALTHACAYISKGCCLLKDYPRDFYYHQLRLFDHGNGGDLPELVLDTVKTSVMLSLLPVSRNHPEAWKILQTCVGFAPDQIPLSILMELLPELNEAQFYGFLDILKSFSLLDIRDKKFISIHRVVLMILDDLWNSPLKRKEHLLSLSGCLKGKFSNDISDREKLKFARNLATHAEACLLLYVDSRETKLAFSILDFKLCEHYLFNESLYSRSVKGFQNSLSLAESQYGPHSFEICSHLTYLALSLRGLGKYAESKSLYERALNIQESTLEPNHISLATTLGNLAITQRELGNYLESKSLHERALKIQESNLGPDHPSLASTLVNLATTLRELGNYLESKILLDRALQIRESTLGPDHPELASTLVNISTTYGELGKHLESKSFLERALKIQESTLGDEHPSVAPTLINLAITQSKLGNYSESKSLYERALKIKEIHFGPDHPELASALGNLATIYLKLGNYRECKPFLERALKIQESTLGPNHPSLASTLANLAIVHGESENYLESKTSLERALKIKESTLGVDHPSLASTLTNLAVTHSRLGNHSESKSISERALKIQEITLGANHPSLTPTLGNLATTYRVLGNFAESQSLYERALKILEFYFGTSHPALTSTLRNLAITHGELGNYAESKLLLERTLKIQESTSGPDNPSLSPTLGNLAVVHLKLGNYSESKSLHERALKIKESTLGPDHPSLVSTLVNLADTLRELGDYSESKSVLERALNIQESTLGSDHPELASTLGNLALTHKELGNNAEAKFLYERVLNLLELNLGSDHPSVATTLTNLATIHQESGNYLESKSLLERALKIQESTLGSDHLDFATGELNLAVCYSEIGLYSQAKALITHAISVYGEKRGVTHPFVLQMEQVLQTLQSKELRNESK